MVALRPFAETMRPATTRARCAGNPSGKGGRGETTMDLRKASRYDAVYQSWKGDPAAFWAEQAKAIDWTRPWDKVLEDTEAPFYRWFAGAELNTCHNALDRHVEGGRAEQPALIYDSPVTGSKKTLYLPGAARPRGQAVGSTAPGVGKGDRVIIYMPMIPEAVMAMLACARLGAVHSVVFGGFAANELATRIDDCTPKLVLTASCGIEPRQGRALQAAARPGDRARRAQAAACLVLQRPQARGVDGQRPRSRLGRARRRTPRRRAASRLVRRRDGSALRSSIRPARPASPRAWCATMAATWSRSTWSMANTSTASSRARSAGAPSDVGWVVGHSYIVYGAADRTARPRSSTKASRSARPIAGAYWRVISEHEAVALFTAPSTSTSAPSRRKTRNAELLKQYDLSEFRTLFLAGERGDPPTIEWAQKLLGVPIVDHWWQTETGWCDRAATSSGSSRCRSSSARARPCRRRAANVPGAGRGRARTGRRSRARSVRWRPSCRCRRASLPDACGTPTSASREAYLDGLSGLLQDGRCRLHRPGRLRLR